MLVGEKLIAVDKVLSHSYFMRFKNSKNLVGLQFGMYLYLAVANTFAKFRLIRSLQRAGLKIDDEI